jgi:co-chaperonin GroES (HSP10)
MTDLSDLGVVDVKKTSENITDESVPDPEGLPEIGGDYVLVRPVKTQTEKVGSVYLADDVQDDVKYLNNVGKILAIGPMAYKKSNGDTVKWFEGGLKVGDYVQWERFVGRRLRYKGVNMTLIKDVALQMKITDPKSLDSFVNLEG